MNRQFLQDDIIKYFKTNKQFLCDDVINYCIIPFLPNVFSVYGFCMCNKHIYESAILYAKSPLKSLETGPLSKVFSSRIEGSYSKYYIKEIKNSNYKMYKKLTPTCQTEIEIIQNYGKSNSNTLISNMFLGKSGYI